MTIQVCMCASVPALVRSLAVSHTNNSSLNYISHYSLTPVLDIFSSPSSHSLRRFVVSPLPVLPHSADLYSLISSSLTPPFYIFMSFSLCCYILFLSIPSLNRFAMNCRLSRTEQTMQGGGIRLFFKVTRRKC